MSTLADDYYVFDPKRHSLLGERGGRKFLLADPVKVKVAGVGLERRRIELVLFDEKAEAKGRKNQKR